MAVLSTLFSLTSIKGLLGKLLNPKVIIAILAIGAIMGGFGWIWYQIDSRASQIDTLETQLDKRKDQISSLESKVKNNRQSFVRLRDAVSRVQKSNRVIREQQQQNEADRDALRQKLNAIDLDQLYEQDPDKADALVNKLFNSRVECLENNENCDNDE